jgi:hypothetical protein
MSTNLSSIPWSGTFPVTSPASQNTTPVAFNDDPIALRSAGDNFHILGYANPWKWTETEVTGLEVAKQLPDVDYWVFNHNLVFATGPARAPRPFVILKNDGKVGVGTMEPQALLDVAGRTQSRRLTLTHLRTVEEARYEDPNRSFSTAALVIDTISGEVFYDYGYSHFYLRNRVTEDQDATGGSPTAPVAGSGATGGTSVPTPPQPTGATVLASAGTAGQADEPEADADEGPRKPGGLAADRVIDTLGS